MWIEKQITIEKKEWESLTEQDLDNISVINNFLYQHEATNEEENEDIIIQSLDEDIIAKWNALKNKFENRIIFISSDPDPSEYLAFTEQNKIAEKERLAISTREWAELANKQDLTNLLKAINVGDELILISIDDVPATKTILESILNNFDQTKVIEYNKQIFEYTGIIDYLITNKDVKENAMSYEKYDADQKRLLAQLNNPVYLERLKKEFNCSLEIAQAHLNTRIANCCIWYSLDNSSWWMESQFVPNKSGAEHATILPSKRENTENRYSFFHEVWWHRVTNAEGVIGESACGLSDYAKRELLNSFDIRIDGEIYWVYSWDTLYLKNISEIYARKKVLDFEMEDLWIKNYEDPFTEDTFEILMWFYTKTIQAIQEWTYNGITAKDMHLLSKNSIQFIQSTKKDFQVYERIFNNIA